MNRFPVITKLIYRLILLKTLSWNWLKRQVLPIPCHRYIFILSPPHCGSTLLTEILLLSKKVSGNNPVGTREGQQLPELRKQMFWKENRWDPDYKMDWSAIKKVWEKYWDMTRPILLEKSPPNIVRASQIAESFQPAYFIILIRNPYAHCESMIRRNGVSPTEAARVALMCMRHQCKNHELLEKSFTLSYEELTNDPLGAVKRIEGFIPELTGIDLSGHKFSAHNFLHQKLGISNLNEPKIKKLTSQELLLINAVFENEKKLIEDWGYSLITVK